MPAIMEIRGHGPLLQYGKLEDLETNELMTAASGVPELSFADYTHGNSIQRAAFARELMHGLQRYGFIILRDHSVSMALLDRACVLSARKIILLPISKSFGKSVLSAMSTMVTT